MQREFIKEQFLLEESFRLAVKIYNSGFKPDVIVGLWRGGSTVGIYVQECLQFLGLKTRHIAVRTSYEGPSSYHEKVLNDENIRVHGLKYLYENLNHSDNLLIVDDVYSSGENVGAVVKKLRRKIKRNMPNEVRISTVWYRSEGNKHNRPPDYFLHKTDAWLVLPYELSGLEMSEIAESKPFLKPIIEDVLENLPVSIPPLRKKSLIIRIQETNTYGLTACQTAYRIFSPNF